MESITLESFFQERVEENERLFTKEEIKQIQRHKVCMHKVYLLGLINGKDCYGKNKILD